MPVISLWTAAKKKRMDWDDLHFRAFFPGLLMTVGRAPARAGLNMEQFLKRPSL
jgi:hypothetical protein